MGVQQAADTVESDFEYNVFINCPYDEAYLELLRPLLFTIVYFGFNPRMSSETSDSGENRLDKICRLIRCSKYSVHDLSRLKAEQAEEYSRMNMPFELGIEYGLRLIDTATLGGKKCLILEKEQYAYMRALSDLSGVDIKCHGNEPSKIVWAVRDWFVETVGLRRVVGPRAIWYAFTDFATAFYEGRKDIGFTAEELNMMPVPEYIDFIREWVAENKA